MYKSLVWRVLWSVLIVLGALVYQELLLPAPADNARAVLEARGVGFALLFGGITLKIMHYFYSRGYFKDFQTYICSSPGKYFGVFSCLYFLIRLPFYTIPFFEEDAYHANIFLPSPPGPEFFLTGWIDGASYFTASAYAPGIVVSAVKLAGYVFSLVYRPAAAKRVLDGGCQSLEFFAVSVCFLAWFSGDLFLFP